MDLVALQKKVKNNDEETRSLKQTAKDVDANIKNPIAKEEKIEFAKRIESFKVTYQFDDGEKTAVLQSRIMDYEQRLKYDRVLAELCGGLVFDNIPIETKNRYIILARAVCQLIDPPEWFLRALGEDLELCYNVGGRLIDHETRFFRYYNRENVEHASKPRFSIS